MTDKPSTEERYITARNGAHILTAAALASIGDEADRVQMALLLWDVTYGGKTEKKHQLAEMLGDRLNRQMDRSKRLKGDAWKVAKQMLAWHLHGICTVCDGRGFETIKGTPSLSKTACWECKGQGKRAYPRDASNVWMAAYLSSLSSIAAWEVAKRLK